MDFHSLTRRELQTLCKKNKIPANTTNVAMADALAALENVEGLEELVNESQSPGKTVPESPSVPRTVTRTSTRRKPFKEDPETAQPTTRTRRTTRRTLDKDLDQENHNVNVPETPAVPASRRRAPAASATKKIDAQLKEDLGQEEVTGVIETPTVQTGRRRAQVGSARRNVAEGSVQHVYSTRRSMRLLEKTMADLSLNEKGRAESLKMDVLDKIKETDASESLKKNNDTVVSSGASFIESLEEELELVEDVHVEDKSNDNGVENCELMGTQNSVNLDNYSVSDAKDETCDESGDLLGDNSDKANSNGPIDVSVSEFGSETESASVEVVMEPEDSLAAKASDETCVKVVADAVDVPATEFGPIDVSVTEFGSETKNASVEVVIEPEDSLAGKASDETCLKVVADTDDVPATEFESEPEKASVKVVMKAEDYLATIAISAEQVEEIHPVELDQKYLEALLPEDKKSEEDSELLDFKNPEADSDQFVSESNAAAQNLQAANECAEEENNYHDNDEQVEEIHPVELDQKYLEALLLPEDKKSEEDSELLDFKNPEADSDQFVSESNAAAQNLQAANECAEGENNYHDNDAAAPSSFDDANIEVEEFDAEELFDVNLIESEEVPISYENEISKLDNPDNKKEEFDTGLVDVKLIEADFFMSDEDKTPNLISGFENEEFDIEGLVDANLAEAEFPMYSENKTPKSTKQITPSYLGINIPVSSLPIESFSGDKTPGYCPVSGGKFSGRNQMSPLGTDSFSSQFPRPTQSTPKLSSKKQTTAQKLTNITADNNKENIDTSGMQLESKKDKVTKNKNTINDDSLNDASLRQLTKMLKEKLQITNKNKKMNNEDQNITQPQFGGKRPALQPLPENLVHPGEPNKEN